MKISLITLHVDTKQGGAFIEVFYSQKQCDQYIKKFLAENDYQDLDDAGMCGDWLTQLEIEIDLTKLKVRGRKVTMITPREERGIMQITDSVNSYFSEGAYKNDIKAAHNFLDRLRK